MSNISPVEQVIAVLQAAGHPVRLKILLALGEGEACVCHLEAILGRRQAYLSQHLMALREAGLVTDRRESRFMFYQLADPRLLDILHQVAWIQKVSLPAMPSSPTCDCPQCRRQRGEEDSGCRPSLDGREPE